MTKIRLHGELGERFGQEYNLAVSSFSEALHAINIKNKNQFYPWLYDKDKTGVKYRILLNGEDFQSDTPLDKLNQKTVESVLLSDLTIKKKLETIDIVPVLEGADSNSLGIITLIVGVLLIATGIGAGLGVGFLSFASGYAGTIALVGVALVAGGIISLLSQPPDFQDFREVANSGKTSYLFSGPQNTVGEGGPVPVGYGRLIIGSQTISASYRIRNVDAGATIGPADGLDNILNTDIYKIRDNPTISVGAPVTAISFSDDGYFNFASYPGGGYPNITNAGSTSENHAISVFKLNESFENANFFHGQGYFPYFSVRDITNDGVIVGLGIGILKTAFYNGRGFIDAQARGIFFPGLVVQRNSFGFLNGSGDSIVNCILETASKNYIVGGNFTSFIAANANSTATVGLTNITKLTRTDSSIEVAGGFTCSVTGGNATVYCLALQSDNKILIGGDFTHVNTIARQNIARINSDGTLDATFDAGSLGAGIVYSVKVLSTGKIVIGGTFSECNGSSTYRKFCRLTSTGTADASVSGGINSDVDIRSIAVQSLDGKILIGGSFVQIGGVASLCLTRINSDFTVDTDFTSGTLFDNNRVNVVKVRDNFNQIAANGKIYVGTLNPIIRKGLSFGGLMILSNDGYVS